MYAKTEMIFCRFARDIAFIVVNSVFFTTQFYFLRLNDVEHFVLAVFTVSPALFQPSVFIYIVAYVDFYHGNVFYAFRKFCFDFVPHRSMYEKNEGHIEIHRMRRINFYLFRLRKNIRKLAETTLLINKHWPI